MTTGNSLHFTRTPPAEQFVTSVFLAGSGYGIATLNDGALIGLLGYFVLGVGIGGLLSSTVFTVVWWLA